MTTEIDTRLDAYIAMLHGGSGLFAASKRVEFDEFRAYANRLEMPRRYPGVQGIGFSRFVPPGDRAHIQNVIATHVPTFKFWSQGSSDELHAIIFLEPENDAEPARDGLQHVLRAESPRGDDPCA